jgi:small subunit ribosomal protein S7
MTNYTKNENEQAKLLLFGKWDSNVEVKDIGLKKYISLKPTIIPKSSGTYRERFEKSKMNIVERLALHLMVSGHSGKRHRLTSGKFGGEFYRMLKVVERAFDIIAERTKKNPVEVLVRAVENAAVCEEIASYQLGGIIARVAVVTSPQRRVDKALRIIAQSVYRASFNNKKRLEEALAEELVNASENSSKSSAITYREKIEQEAMGAR